MTHRDLSAAGLARGAASLSAGYFFLVWSGLELPGLSHDHYDQWRQAQLLALLALWVGVALWAARRRLTARAGRGRFAGALLALPLGWTLLALLAHRQPSPGPVSSAVPRALADLGLWLSLGAAMPLLAAALASAARRADRVPQPWAWIETLAAWMALMPIMATPTLVFHLYSSLVQGVDEPWHLAFANARYFDNALMPCLLLLWLRPGWLAAPRWAGLVLAASGWYLFSLMIDGARGDLLCLAVALAAAVGLGRRRAWPVLRMALAATALAGLGLALVRGLGAPPSNPHMVLAHADSSGRSTHWRMIFEILRQRSAAQLLTGFGGDGLLAAMAPFGHDPDPVRVWISGIVHPHNMAIQWLTEWGLAGVALCGLALLPLGWCWRRRHQLPVLGFGAVLALYLDGLLSGFWIYPQSEMTGLWLMAWLVAAGHARGDAPRPAPGGRAPASTLLCFTALGLGLSLLLFVHARDLLAAQDYESPGRWPRFWSDGAMLHLPPARPAPAGARPGP